MTRSDLQPHLRSLNPRQVQSALPDARLTGAYIAELCARRESMLASIESDISASLRTAIEAKLSYERGALSEILERRERAVEEEKELILNTQYFVLRKLEADTW